MFVWIDWALKACFLMGGRWSYVPHCGLSLPDALHLGLSPLGAVLIL